MSDSYDTLKRQKDEMILERQKAADRDECEVLRAALKKLLAAPGDHMTACDRTMGATHPCTCGANEARRILSEFSEAKR